MTTPAPELAQTENDLGVAYHNSNFTEAEGHYKAAIRMWEATVGPMLKAMARVAGFPNIEEVDHPEYVICRKHKQ